MNNLVPVTFVAGTIPFAASALDFTRQSFGVRNRVHAESRCNQCGFKIVGKLDTFDEQEQEHAATQCGGARPE